MTVQCIYLSTVNTIIGRLVLTQYSLFSICLEYIFETHALPLPLSHTHLLASQSHPCLKQFEGQDRGKVVVVKI